MLEHILSDAVTSAQWVLVMIALVILMFPYLVERFRLPGLLGLVIGGMIAGPYVIGWLPEGSLDAIGGIGILYLMFLAGAELDLNLFQRLRRTAFSFGALTFLGPFLLGMGASIWFGLSLPAAILMGSVWASHTLVAYPQVREAGLSGNKAVATAVSATVITDTLALVVLAIVAGATTSEGGGSTLELVGIAARVGLGLVVLAFYCLWLLPRIGRWFFAGPGQERVLRFVFILGGLASAGLLAELVGVEGIVGAFFAGLGLNRLIPNDGQLMERVEFFGSALFIPAFLISVGMLLNPQLLFNPNTLFMALVFFLALGTGKFLAAFITGKRNRFSFPEIGLMFSLTIAQAAATLAATLVGFDIGLFDASIVNAVLLVVLVSLIVTSIGTQTFSRSVHPEKVSIQPLGKSVVVVVRPSQQIDRLMSTAAAISNLDAGVIIPVAIVPESHAGWERAEAEEWLQKAEQAGSASAADVEGVLRIDSSTHQGIARQVTERDASLVLAQWQPSSRVRRFLYGDELDRIGAQSPSPTAAVRFVESDIKRLVLVAGLDDGSTGYRVDLTVAIGLATRISQSMNLPLTLLTPNQALPEGTEIPENCEMKQVQPGLKNIPPHLQESDFIILPAAVLHRYAGNRFAELLKVGSQYSVLVAAGPFRLSLSSAPTRRERDTVVALGGTS